MSDQTLPESFTKKIAYSYQSILTAKLRNFYKRSLWKYTFSSVLYAAGLRIIRGHDVLTVDTLWLFVNFYLILLSLVLILMVVSSAIMARKYGEKHLIYTFSPEGLHILNEINGQEEAHGWDWIRSVEEGRKALYLIIDMKRHFELILQKDKMNAAETEALKSWHNAAAGDES